MRPDRLVDIALRCYPAWWQDRYAIEVRTVADDLRTAGRSSVRIFLDLVVGMFRVRRDAVGMPRSYPLWNARTRVSVATATLPFVLLAPVVVACSGSTGLRAKGTRVVYSGFSLFPHGLMRFGKGGLLPAPPLTPAATVISWAELAVLVVSLLTLVTVFYGWASILGAVRHAGPRPRRWARLLAWTPALVIVVFIALTALATRVGPHEWTSTGGRPMAPVGGTVGLAHLLIHLAQVVLVGGWLLSAAAIAAVARWTEMTPFALRTGTRVSSVTAALAVLLAAALAAWGVGVILQAHQAGHGTYTVFEFGHLSLWPVSAAAALLACHLSLTGATRAHQGSQVVAGLCG